MHNNNKADKTLADLSRQYLTGKLSKTDYIKLMHQKHLALFDYYDYLKSTDIESITIGPDAILVTVRGSKLKLLLDKKDSRFIPIEMLNFKRIDPKEMDLLAKIMPNKATVLDIGANIGWFTLFFATLPKVKQIYAFEPIPYTFRYLQKHLKINGIRKAQAINCGLGEKAETKTFYWTPKETGSSSLTNLRDRSVINKVRCKITTLDKFTKSRQAKVDLIKCDVEGAELFVFKGGLKAIARDKPIIYTELLRKWSKKFGYHPNDLIDLLNSLGYQCYGYVGNKLKKIKHMTDDLETTNFFFFHQQKHGQIIRRFSR